MMRPHFLLSALLALVIGGAQRAAAQSPYEWVKVTGTSPPVAVYEDWQMAYDKSLGLVMAVPRRGDGVKETWLWNGQAWTPNGYPSPDASHGLVYHETTSSSYRLKEGASLAPMGTVVLVDGVGWVQVDSNGPTTRDDFAWAYDAVRERTVLFGGNYGFQGIHPAYTWEWDSLSWTVYDTEAEGPPRRRSTAMAYDAKNQVVVLYGGWGVDNRLSDTWTWDGQTWQVHNVAGPGPRSNHGMIYDAEREKVLLFGGSSDTQQQLGDLWEWNGSSWSQVPVSGPEPRETVPGFVYDEARGEAILYSGTYREDAKPVPLPDTWILRIRSAWVDFGYSGTENGEFNTPYNTVQEAVNALPPEGHVHLKPGASSETITISKELRIDAPLGTATIGQQ